MYLHGWCCKLDFIDFDILKVNWPRRSQAGEGYPEMVMERTTQCGTLVCRKEYGLET